LSQVDAMHQWLRAAPEASVAPALVAIELR